MTACKFQAEGDRSDRYLLRVGTEGSLQVVILARLWCIVNSSSQLFTQSSGIILAADVSSLEDFRSLINACSGFPEIVAVKVGFTLALRYGLPLVIRTASETTGVPVIYDHQKAATDIPQTGKLFAATCRDAGVKAVILFPQAGPKTLEGFVSGAITFGLTPIVGLVMTHDAYLESEGGYIVNEAPEQMARLAIALGVRDFVLPGTKPEIVRRFAAGPLVGVQMASILMPGIGSQGGSCNAAFRAALPHNRFAIIGSAIYTAKEPRRALECFIQEMRHE